MTYKFRAGEAITLKPDHNLNVPGGAYEVVKRLPGTSGEPEYRIKSANEPRLLTRNGNKWNELFRSVLAAVSILRSGRA
jgi:hypothetical protein